jgi:hypothetical protein
MKAMIVHPKIVVGEYYQSSKSQHYKNERIHVIQGPQSILQSVLNGGRAEYIYI